MVNSDLTKAVLIMGFLTIVSILAKNMLLEVNPNNTALACVSDSHNDITTEWNTNTTGGYNLKTSGISNDLPTVNQGIGVSTSGGFFTDIFNAGKSFFTSTTKGVKILYGLVSAPGCILSYVGLPDYLSFSIGIVWAILALFLIISWLLGR